MKKFLPDCLLAHLHFISSQGNRHPSFSESLKKKKGRETELEKMAAMEEIRLFLGGGRLRWCFEKKICYCARTTAAVAVKVPGSS